MNKKTVSDSTRHSKGAEAILPEGPQLPQGDVASAATLQPESVSTQVRTKTLRRHFSVEYKLNFLAAYEACDNALARGELLRREGLYHSRITAWRQQRDAGKFGKPTKNKSDNKMRRLARENEALKKKLAQAEAVIDLQKKVSELLGQHILAPDSNGDIS